MMKEIVYNKLVRDRIPEIIRANKQDPVIHIANDDEYRDHLFQKVAEEIKEFQENPCEEEMADVLEVLDALAAFYGLEPLKIQQIQYDKAAERGKFADRIILEKVVEEKIQNQ